VTTNNRATSYDELEKIKQSETSTSYDVINQPSAQTQTIQNVTKECATSNSELNPSFSNLPSLNSVQDVHVKSSKLINSGSTLKVTESAFVIDTAASNSRLIEPVIRTRSQKDVSKSMPKNSPATESNFNASTAMVNKNAVDIPYFPKLDKLNGFDSFMLLILRE